MNNLDSDEFDKKICKAFPNLYKDRKASMQTTCMCWGFEISQGWQQLVWDLSEKLEAEILKQPKAERKNYRASQVKSKYAGLRFYMTASTDEMDKLISAAEDISEQTCEPCGKPGKIYGGGWVTCYCDDCARSRNMFVKSEDLP